MGAKKILFFSLLFVVILIILISVVLIKSNKVEGIEVKNLQINGDHSVSFTLFNSRDVFCNCSVILNVLKNNFPVVKLEKYFGVIDSNESVNWSIYGFEMPEGESVVKVSTKCNNLKS
jgi:hypothetical protein